MFKPEKKKLIVVYKNADEMALNYLKKLIETKDDENGNIVGTEDDTVSVIAWTEKVFLDNKSTRDISNKIIFLGDVKGIKNIIPILDLKYSEYGVSYGFSGNQAVISIDERMLDSDKAFISFQNEYNSLVKYLQENDNPLEKGKEFNSHQGARISKVFAIALALTYPIVGVPFAIGAAINGSIDRKHIREKMFLFGITKFYLEEMDSFLKS